MRSGGRDQPSLISSSRAIIAPRICSKRFGTSSCSGLSGFCPRSSLPSLFSQTGVARVRFGRRSALPLGAAQLPQVVAQHPGLDPAGGVAITAKAPRDPQQPQLEQRTIGLSGGGDAAVFAGADRVAHKGTC